MITRNYKTGLVASGPGFVVLTGKENSEYAVSSSGTESPVIEVRHYLPKSQDKTVYLESGEFLWIWSPKLVAVSADNPASGSV